MTLVSLVCRGRVAAALTVLATLAFATQVSANTIFDATTANVTAHHNGVAGVTTIFDPDGPDPLAYSLTEGQNNSAGGFNSTDTINTLNGSAITAADQVVLTAVVTSGTGNLGFNGTEFGIGPGTGFRPADNMIVQVDADGDISGWAANNVNELGRNTETWGIEEASLYDGYTIVMTANASGVSTMISDIITTAASADPGATSATWDTVGYPDGTTFEDLFGNGNLYFCTQHGDGEWHFSSVTMEVSPIPEPSSLALLGIGAWALAARRRKA